MPHGISHDALGQFRPECNCLGTVRNQHELTTKVVTQLFGATGSDGHLSNQREPSRSVRLGDDQTMNTTGQPKQEQDDQSDQDGPDDKFAPVKLALTGQLIRRGDDGGLEEEQERTDQEGEDDEPDQAIETDTLHVYDRGTGGRDTVGASIGSKIITRLLRNSGVHCF